MEQNHDQEKDLLSRYNQGLTTPEENRQVEHALNLLAGDLPENAGAVIPDADGERIWSRVEEHLTATPTRVRRLWPRVAAAAAILLFSTIGGYYLLRQDKPAQQIAQSNPEERLPQPAGVTLTLGNGKQIAINTQASGKLNTTDGSAASQDHNTLSYANEPAREELQMHTLTNNSGNKFSLTLADGTQAYLDAASSISYPAAFNGRERKISVTGQVYLKVAHNAAQPFLVSAGKATIRDIGTEFNINAYGDDASVKTTLVEGAVSISTADKTKMLSPGQKAELNEANDLIIKNADMEAETSWLQGKLVFHHEALESIMKKIARIYDVQVIWADEQAKTVTFNGSVNRTKKLATVLNFFRKTGEVEFKVEGKTITISSKRK